MKSLKRTNKILLFLLIVITAYLGFQKITEPYRSLFNHCYYVQEVGKPNKTDAYLTERKDYCQQWAIDELNERGD